MADPIVYLNGEFVPYDQAKIGIEDRSVQFGDGGNQQQLDQFRRLQQQLQELQNQQRGRRRP